MHGFTTPGTFEHTDPIEPPLDAARSARRWGRVRAMAHRFRWLLALVVLPTLITTIYYGLLAADQYESEAHFVVRVAGASQGASSGLGQLLGLNSTLSPSQTESLGLGDYLTSHDAVDMLDRRLGLVRLFRRPEIDVVSRLRADPAPETLLRYYRKHIALAYNSETGITTMRVLAFRPHDALAIAATLLAIGERRVNQLNQRAYNDALAVTQGQLADAEREMHTVQGGLTQFRQTQHDIDPGRTSTAQIQLVSTLQTQLAGARAQLSSMTGAISPGSPQYQATRDRVRALAGQVAAESAKLTGGGHAVAVGLGSYEQLQLRQDFASKRYAAAAAAVESAREQAIRQQLFVIRVVEPNLPVKALYPERLKYIATVFFGLLLAYGIGWLIVAGVREHAA